MGSDVITNTGWRSGVRYFALFPGNTSSLDREYGARFFWSSVPAAISSTSFPAMTWKTVGRVRAGLIAGGTAATLAEGGAADGEDSAEAAGADGERMASMTFSGTPFFLSAISASVRTSKFVGLVRIFATMTRSESPALTISTTD